MEKKKLHRVVGILILIAVVIVILPLVTGKRDLPVNRMLSVEAPPFPASSGAEVDNAPAGQPEQPPTMIPPFSEPSPSPAPSATPETSSVTPSVTPPVAEPVASPAKEEASPQALAEPPVAVSAPSSTAQAASPNKKPTAARPASIAWAVQMGNFHNHNNAVRLANRLRMAGYKAYTRQIVSRTGNISTRVYVGSGLAEASAKKLSQKIHSHLNLDGLVVTVESLPV